MPSNRQERLLHELLSLPTAPFREYHIARLARRELDAAGIAWFDDPAGNIVVGADSPKAYRAILNRRGGAPLKLFIAHMDHPGFHGLRWTHAGRLAVRFHGGTPVRHVSGARVWLADEQDYRATGVLRRVRLAGHGRAIHEAEVHLDAPLEVPVAARRLFGAFDFRAPVWRAGKRLYTRAADDLIGVFAILETARAVRRKEQAADFLGLLTRGEEVGFAGAMAHFDQGWLDRARREVVCVSLEASRTLPGAEIGKGPILRLGDRMTVFNPDATQVLFEAARRALGARGWQRRIMDGGACEASAATAYGYATIGISLPLGNYHNQGFEGGQDCPKPGGAAPEFVHVDDVAAELKLCKALLDARLPWDDPWGKFRARLQKRARRYRKLLAEPI